MRKFLLGFAIAIVLVFLAGFCFVRLGLVDPRADIEMGVLESRIAMPALDAAVDRRAPKTPNPVPATDANLTAGMKIYQANCASCHGDIQHPQARLAEAFYPRAPQFVTDAPDMPEYQNFYIIQHGVRLSGMPAWGHLLSKQETWQTTLFLGHMDQLLPQISEAWKTMAASPLDAKPSSDASGVHKNEPKSMDMPMH